MKSVLLVDDDSTSNFIHKKMLQLTGIVNSIDIAHNGREALFMMDNYAATQKFPDLILLDINMPILDGFGFLQWYNQLSLPEKTGSKIIVLSSSVNESDIQRAKSFGVFRYLIKPLHSDQIVDILKSW